MNEPTLVIMAAGMGNRYGGLKQIDPIGPHGEIIIDYSLYDAMQAGFQKVVFIVNERIKADFTEVVGKRIEKRFDVSYVCQEIGSFLPAGVTPPPERKKPWGTAHAILCCKDVIDGPFAAINADDYYGREAYRLIYERLRRARDGERYDYCMVGYVIDNTLSDSGSVARGVCEVDEQGRLVDIAERLKVVRTPDGPAYVGDDGETLVPVPSGNLVSMNYFGFTPSLFAELENQFPVFLADALESNPLGAEMYIPKETGRLLREKKASVEVMPTHDKWYGVTYRADKPGVMAALAEMTKKGYYPDRRLF